MSTVPPQFGRHWRLEIADASGNILIAAEDNNTGTGLQIEFEVRLAVNSDLGFADISLYNLNAATDQVAILQGMRVTLYAGYQGQPYGVIFQGPVFQPTLEQLNVTDFKLTLHCIIGFAYSVDNFVSGTTAAGLTQRDIIASMAQFSRTPINIAGLDSEELSKIKYPRPQVLFGGNPVQQIADLAKDAGLNTWADNYGIYVRSLSQPTDVATYTFGVGTGLIGTPQQTQDGVVCSVLMDSRISLREQVRLLSQVRALERAPNTLPPILDPEGLYIVLALRHIGSSRGNAWQTELTCGSSYGGKLGFNY